MALNVLDIRGRTEPIDLVGNMQKGMAFRRERAMNAAHDNYKTQLAGIAAGLDAGTYDPTRAQELANAAYRDSGYSNFDDPDANGITLHQRTMSALFGGSQQLETLRDNNRIATESPPETQAVDLATAAANRATRYGDNAGRDQAVQQAVAKAVPYLNSALAGMPGDNASDEEHAAFAKRLTVGLVPFRMAGYDGGVTWDPESKSYVTSVNGNPTGAFKDGRQMAQFIHLITNPGENQGDTAYAVQVKQAQDQVATRQQIATKAAETKLDIIRNASQLLGPLQFPAFNSGVNATTALNGSGWTVIKAVDNDAGGSTILMEDKTGHQVVAKMSAGDGKGGLGGAVTYETPDGRPVSADKLGGAASAMQDVAISYGAMSKQAQTMYASQFLQFQLNAVDAVTGQGGGGGGQPATVPDDNEGRAVPLPRGLRTNNPGNLRTGGKFSGETGAQDGFAQFGSMGDGIRAAATNLRAYQQKHGLNTVAGIINRWAPPGENNTSAYVAQVAQQVGVEPNAKLDLSDPQTMGKLLGAIFQHENGQPIDAQQIAEALGGARNPQNLPRAIPDDNEGRALPPPGTRVASTNRPSGKLSPDEITASIADYLRLR